jgi:hypothetical protein
MDPSSFLFSPFVIDETPHLTALNWKEFSSVMEMLFYSLEADYLVGPGPSTTVPNTSFLLDQDIHVFLLHKTADDDQLYDIIANTSSALQAWLLLTEHFQGPFLPPPHDITIISDPTPDFMTTIPPSPPAVPSLDIGLIVPHQDINCSSLSDQDHPTMDSRTQSSQPISAFGKISSYTLLSVAIVRLAFPIKTFLSHSALTHLPLFHDWPG